MGGHSLRAFPRGRESNPLKSKKEAFPGGYTSLSFAAMRLDNIKPQKKLLLALWRSLRDRGCPSLHPLLLVQRQQFLTVNRHISWGFNPQANLSTIYINNCDTDVFANVNFFAKLP